MKLVIYPPVDERRLDVIHRAAPSLSIVNAAEEAVAEREIADAEGFFGKITPALLEAAARLRWIQTATASLEHYVFPELIAHPCRLSNVRGIYSDVIADHVFGFIACFARNLHIYLRQMAAGLWQPYGGGPIEQPFATGPADDHPGNHSHRRLADCSLGIVGLGHIGRAIAERGIALGMKTRAVDPRSALAPEGMEGLWPTSDLPRLLGGSDFVVIAAPHTPATEKLFRREQFEQMKREAVLVNVGRGAIVDLADLTDALQRQVIAGAALDVCEIEPLPPDHPLWRLPNVIITPHVAAFSRRIPERHLALVAENIGRFARGEEPLNLVDKASWF